MGVQLVLLRILGSRPGPSGVAQALSSSEGRNSEKINVAIKQETICINMFVYLVYSSLSSPPVLNNHLLLPLLCNLVQLPLIRLEPLGNPIF